MNFRIIEQLQHAGHNFHLCCRGADGHCYYIYSDGRRRDYGDKIGRIFYAVREMKSGSLEEAIRYGLFISGTAAKTSRFVKINGDVDNYLIEAGISRIRVLLRAAITTPVTEQVTLTTHSADSDFKYEEFDPLQDQAELRNEILAGIGRIEATKSEGAQRHEVVARICTNPRWVDRQIMVLQEGQLISGATQDRMRLTATGHTRVAEMISKPKRNETVSIQKMHKPPAFDVFISYASEDKAIVQALYNALESKGVKAWHDMGQITLGDGITDKINAGLSGSRFGLVILSGNFLAKNWPMTELRTLFKLQTDSGQKKILPLLHNISAEQLTESFPLLADIRAEPVEEANVEKIVDVVIETIRRET